MPVAGGDDGIRVGHDAGGERVPEAQHVERLRPAAVHYLEIEAGGEDLLAARQDDRRAVRFGAIEGAI